MGFIFRHAPKEGSPGFRLGWMHGCESGLGTQFGGAIYQSFYGWKRDADIASYNPDYKKIKDRYRKELRGVNWNNIQELLPDLLENYPSNMHKVVSWWIKYKRDLGSRIMEQLNA